jgi:hypothetical protein
MAKIGNYWDCNGRVVNPSSHLYSRNISEGGRLCNIILMP